MRDRSQHWIAVAATLLLACLPAHGLLPDLRGVHVFVAGASATTSERYVEVQDFWLKYLQAAGGEISARTYGRVAFTFE